MQVDDWRRETMADLAKDSPYYHELRERCPDCGQRTGFTVCRGHDDYGADFYDDDTEDVGDE